MSNREQCPCLPLQSQRARRPLARYLKSHGPPCLRARDPESATLEDEDRVGHRQGGLAPCRAQSLGPHIPCNPHSKAWELVLLLPLFCRQGSQGSERLCDFPRVTRLVELVLRPRSARNQRRFPFATQGSPGSEGRQSPSSLVGRSRLQHLLQWGSPAPGPTCSQVRPEPGPVLSETETIWPAPSLQQ